MDSVRKIVVLASGRGSNFQAVLRAVQENRVRNASISLLVTDRENTGAAAIAGENNIKTIVIPFKSFAHREDYDSALDEVLSAADPDLILTLGYMRLIRPETVKKFKYKIINIHPSLLPAFPGMHAQKQAYDYGVKITGATVHFMDEGMDTGPVILQAAVPVHPDHDLASLEKSILEQEHRIICEAVRLFCEDRIRVEGRKTIISY